MPVVRGRVGSINCRRSSNKPDWLIRSRYWPNRDQYLIQALDNSGCSIFGTQECTLEQSADITRRLGLNWAFFGGEAAGEGNTPILWDGVKWHAVDDLEVELPTPGRWLVAVRLASRPPKLPGSLWVASVHLTRGDTATARDARHKEIRAAIRHIQKLPGWRHTALCGDFNSDGYVGSRVGGVRTIAAELGFRDLRSRVNLRDNFARESYSSFNGWQDTPQTGRWIDDILTPADVQPYAGALEFTCTRVYDGCGSDHNIIRASVQWPADPQETTP